MISADSHLTGMEFVSFDAPVDYFFEVFLWGSIASEVIACVGVSSMTSFICCFCGSDVVALSQVFQRSCSKLTALSIARHCQRLFMGRAKINPELVCF